MTTLLPTAPAAAAVTMTTRTTPIPNRTPSHVPMPTLPPTTPATIRSLSPTSRNLSFRPPLSGPRAHLRRSGLAARQSPGVIRRSRPCHACCRRDIPRMVTPGRCCRERRSSEGHLRGRTASTPLWRQGCARPTAPTCAASASALGCRRRLLRRQWCIAIVFFSTDPMPATTDFWLRPRHCFWRQRQRKQHAF